MQRQLIAKSISGFTENTASSLSNVWLRFPWLKEYNLLEYNTMGFARLKMGIFRYSLIASRQNDSSSKQLTEWSIIRIFFFLQPHRNTVD